jgi:hypothetical protein
MASDFEIISPKTRNLLGSSEVEDAHLKVSPAGGDLLGEGLYLGNGTVYRSWYLEIALPNMGRREQSVKISLRFNPLQSLLVLIVNGVPKVKCATEFENSFMNLKFKLLEIDFELWIRVNFPKISYHIELRLNNAEVKDLRNQKTIPNSLVRTDTPRVTIPNIRTCSIQNKSVVVYQICSEIKAQNEKVVVERRFSDFDKLDKIIQGHFSVSHLKDTLPTLPTKVYNPFFNQTEFHFLTTRKAKLEEYLNFLLSNEKVKLA